jgi:predicted permease
LAPAVTKEQATAVTRSVAILTQPDSSRRAGAVRAAEVHATRDAPPASELDDGITVFAAVGAIALLILLVVCTNVSSLMVASAVGRRHEIAVRLSMGASRARVLRQLLTEAMLLALAGGSAGLLLYWWITAWLTTRVHLNIEVAPDVTTVLFTMLFALGTGVFFGLSPALHATRSVAGALREVGTGGVRRSRLQSTFVAAQIVFSQPLLVMLGILLAGIVGERDQPPRSASRVVTAWLPPVSRAGAMSQRLAQVDSLMPRIATQPGVIAAVPEAAGFAMRNVWVPAPDAASPRASDAVRVHVVGTAPGYFELLDVPIRLGRDVSLADTVGAEYAIVIHSDLARSLWGDVIPLGKRLASVDWRAGARDSVGMVVVGVIDAVATTTRGELGQKVYTANGKRWRRNAILIRTQGPAPASVPMLRQFFLREAAGLPVGGVEPLEDVYRRSNDLDLKVAAAAGAAGALALLLASLGLYGVVSLAVSQRTREIGIRIAIGARPQRVAAMFFASGVRVSAIALAIGLPLSVLGVQVLLAYGVAIAPVPNLWVLGLGIGAVMLLVASAATWWPARRAASVDPAQTLRVD